MSTSRKRGLGRTLDVLLSSNSQDGATTPADVADAQRELPVASLQAGAHQPRRYFDPQALEELAASIAAQGVVQPVVVRPLDGDRYEIVAGERRWRAAQQAGLHSIPAVVRVLDDRGAMAVALVENIQRADLNPLEEAEALQRLIAQCSFTHEQVAEAVGKSRAAVSNLLRLTELQPALQQWIREARLSLGHAKVLLGAAPERRAALAAQVVEGQLSVRQTEALLKAPPITDSESDTDAETGGARRTSARGTSVSPLQTRAAQCIGLPVRLQQGPQGQGRLTISFRTASELEQLLSRLS